MPLSDIQCRAATAGDLKIRKLHDAGGLYLWVDAKGSKRWRFRYQWQGKERIVSLGVYPAISLKTARLKRDELRLQLANGVEPSEARQQAKRAAQASAENSFAQVAQEYCAVMKKKWSTDHTKYTMRRFEQYVFPSIGYLDVAAIPSKDLLKIVRAIELQGTIETAYKVIGSCSQVFRFAIASGRCKHNPALDIKPAMQPMPKRKHMAAVSAEDLPQLLRSIHSYRAEGGDLQTELGLKLLAYTWVRTTELRAATWDELDLDQAIWTIPAERMKAREIHRIPLSSQAIACFRLLHNINGHLKWVFPGRSALKPISKNTFLFSLYRMGYHGKMTGHGFRAIASTLLNEAGFNPDAIERQLAHVETNKIRAAYNRADYWEERSRMMQWWADGLDALLLGPFAELFTR